MVSLSRTVRLCTIFVTSRPIRKSIQSDPTTPNIQRFRALTYIRFGLFPVRSPLLGKSLLFSLPEATKMFQFASFASAPYVFRYRCSDITRNGFPHSEISGSKLVSSSPKLIAACHVFHRLSIPRHPPSALNNLAP